MSVATLSPPVGTVKSVSPYVSQQELLLAVAAGKISVDAAGPLLAGFAKPAADFGVNRRPWARRNRHESGVVRLTIGLGVKPTKGCTATLTLARPMLEKLVELVTDGTIQGYLDGWDSIPFTAEKGV